MEVWVTGGYFDDTGECFVDSVDLARGTRRRLLSFMPPDEHRVTTKGFTGACWADADTLLVCSFNAVWRIPIRTWRCEDRLFQPDFNDLHHVSVDSAHKRIYVCNTGLDAVEVFDTSGRFVGRHATSPAWFEARRQAGETVARADFPEVLRAGWSPRAGAGPASTDDAYYEAGAANPAFDRRIVRDFVHPNHVVRMGDRLAVTCLATREVRCFWTHEVLCKFDGHPHDGVDQGGLFWTTCTNGLVTAWRPGAGGWRPEARLDTAATGHVGWCRGLLVTAEDVVVGLTAIHGRPQYPWRDDPPGATETSVLWLDRATGALRGRVDLTDGARRTKIFSVLAPTGG